MVDMFRLDHKVEVERPQLDMAEVAKLPPQVDKVKQNIALGVNPKDTANDRPAVRAGCFVKIRKCTIYLHKFNCHPIILLSAQKTDISTILLSAAEPIN